MRKRHIVMALLLTAALASYGQRIWQPGKEISVTLGKNFESDGMVIAKADYTRYTKSNFGFGAGSGVWFFDDGDIAVPLSAHATYHYPLKRFTPYAKLSVGSMVQFGDGASGIGFFYTSAVGVKIPLLKRLALNLNANYLGVLIEGEGTFGFNAGVSFCLGKNKSK